MFCYTTMAKITLPKLNSSSNNKSLENTSSHSKTAMKKVKSKLHSDDSAALKSLRNVSSESNKSTKQIKNKSPHHTKAFNKRKNKLNSDSKSFEALSSCTSKSENACKNSNKKILAGESIQPQKSSKNDKTVVETKQTAGEVSNSETEELESIPERKRKHPDDGTEQSSVAQKKARKMKPDEGYGLFVGKVPKTAKASALREAFKKFGDIARVILPEERHPKGVKKSEYSNRGHGIVIYHAKESLEAALAQKKHKVNGHNVYVRADVNREVKEAKSQGKTNKNSKKANTTMGYIIYISNIKKGTPCEELEEYFTQFGDVSNVIVCPANGTLKKPYAQVVFDSAEAKAAALAKSKHMMGSVALSVGATKTSVLGENAMEKLRNDHELFVAKLSEDTSVETLRKHFSKYGTVTKVFQPRCPVTNKPKCCAFVAFKSADSVKAALEEDHEIDMRTLLVRDSKVDVGKKMESGLRPEVDQSHALFVARVPLDTGKETLVTYFSKYGEVADVRMAWDRELKCSKSYGLVFFSTEDGLQAALSEQHKINGTKIFVKKNERNIGQHSEQSEQKQGGGVKSGDDVGNDVQGGVGDEGDTESEENTDDSDEEGEDDDDNEADDDNEEDNDNEEDEDDNEGEEDEEQEGDEEEENEDEDEEREKQGDDEESSDEESENEE